ncbi:hydroxymethylglutaryl-CoA lyase [Fodinicola acaciae]|uniref:hydroxymethylglutaryl-CoA lyase n=1 Tax=Fodinicola acaciae TaxID=2681555 RepID=UPI0013CF7D3A|nr:hydroxymethylglutaryl-CoA lyase [Fodinicola acaciae]
MRITDVVLRDGLQDEPVIVSTVDKVRIFDALVDAGVREIEAVSFVSRHRVPQMADAESLLSALGRRPGTRISGIALNLRGALRARDCQLDELRLVVSASEGHSAANAGRTTEKALDEIDEAVASLPGIDLVGAVSTAFVCPYDGVLSAARLLWVVGRLFSAGLRRISLADTLGTATPDHVRRSVDAVRSAYPDVELSLHLHNTAGQALDSVDAVAGLGIVGLDSSLGGLGGCPFAPGAAGNLDTATLVRHLDSRDIPTGISLSALHDATTLLTSILSHSPAA